MNTIAMIPFGDQHLDMVRIWRNNPEVRENMYTNHEIGKKEHEQWFNELLTDSSRKFFIFELNGEPSGVIGFTQIDQVSNSASWLFYSGDTSKRGVGSLMETTALDYAFDEMKLNKLNCEVLEFNDAVIRFHRKHGFKIEGIFKRQYFKHEKYWDIYRLAIFKKDWLLSKVSLENRMNDSFKVGTQYTHEFTISEDQISTFANATGDHNSIHLSDESATKHGLKGKIAHGFLTGSIFSKVFGTLFPGEGTIYIDQSLKFIKPVYPNASLIANFKVLSRIGNRITIDTNIVDNDSNLLLVSGEANVILPESVDKI